MKPTIALRIGLLLPSMLALTEAAMAANSFTNSLTGFTGDSTQAATQTAVAAAGFNFSDVADSNAAVHFNTSGANFDVSNLGNDGRNYMRTVDTDYANTSFVAEVTIVTPDIDNQDAYFGLGSGSANPDFFRTPDFASEFASVMYWGENEVAEPTLEIGKTNNAQGNFNLTPAPALGNGTHRVRLSYDWFRKTASFTFDLDYAGGEFNADLAPPAVNTLSLYSATGWPTEPGRVFFGGDENVVFKDFQVTVSSTPVVYGDLNNNGTITSADWMILRTNLYADTSGSSHQQAYFLGDLTADLAINHSDFFAFKILYDNVNGAGSFVEMLASVPEPITLALVVPPALMIVLVRRRAAHCTNGN
jgi:hypothetical protein